VNVNWKLSSAFAAGAVLASGIVYFAVRPVSIDSVDSPRPVAAPAIAPKPVAPPYAPPPAAEIASAPAPPAPAPPVHVRERLSRVPIREKPSPMPSPVRHQKEVVIARNDPPAPPPPVETKPDPPPVIVAAPAPPQNVPVQNVSLPAPSIETRVPHTVTLATGTLLPVRVGETLSSAHNQPGDTFLATLTQPLVIDGFIIAERGARLEGRVVQAGASRLGISVVRLATADGQNIRIRTEPFVKQAGSSAGTDAAKIGGGAALGAIIGAIAGGGKGAAIGAGAGGAVGAGDVLLTRGQAAEITVETRVTFRVQDSITITERLD
jgi:hypothetical protein